MTYPRAFSHIGLSVPDLEKAVDFYTSVLGFTVLIGPSQNDGDDSHLGRLNKGVFGENFKKSRIAHLVTADGVGIELFQFVDPAYEEPEDNFAYWRGGIFHFCIMDPDIEGLLQRIVENGGKARSEIATLFPGEPYKMVYCEDPFGNPFEIYTHSYEQFFSNRSY